MVRWEQVILCVTEFVLPDVCLIVTALRGDCAYMAMSLIVDRDD